MKMDAELERILKKFDEIIESFGYISSDEIPNIELYMDQVISFMDRHLRHGARDPEMDKLLTKTMINNYTKNNVLIPPVRKKYGMDHMILLLMIFYFKSFLSIGDIASILEPVKDHHTAAEGDEEGTAPYRYSLKDIYDVIYGGLDGLLHEVAEDTKRQVMAVEDSFTDADPDEGQRLRRFNLICRLSAEIYLRKLLIERLIDEDEESSGRRTGKDRKNRKKQR